MSENLPAVQSGAVAVSDRYNQGEIETIKATHFKELDEPQIQYALKKAERMGLDFFTGDVVAWKGREGRVEVYTTIHGLRRKAEETGLYFPGRATTFEHDDNGRLISATAYTNRWDERVQKYVEISDVALMAECGKSTGAWQSHPHVMLAKCAEAFVLRRVFPSLGSLYITEERDSQEAQDAARSTDRDAARAAKMERINKAEVPLKVVEAKKEESPPEPLKVVEAKKEESPPEPQKQPEPEKKDSSTLLDDTRKIVAALSLPKKIVLFKRLGMDPATEKELEKLSEESLAKVFDAAAVVRG